MSDCRMLPDISRWPAQQFYGGVLSNGPNTLAAGYGRSRVSLPAGLPAYAFISTSAAAQPADAAGMPRRVRPAAGAAAYLEQRGTGSSSSWCNEGEVAVVEALLLALQACCKPGTSVGIISPYAAQVRLPGGSRSWLGSCTTASVDVRQPS